MSSFREEPVTRERLLAVTVAAVSILAAVLSAAVVDEPARSGPPTYESNIRLAIGITVESVAATGT